MFCSTVSPASSLVGPAPKPLLGAQTFNQSLQLAKSAKKSKATHHSKWDGIYLRGTLTTIIAALSHKNKNATKGEEDIAAAVPTERLLFFQNSYSMSAISDSRHDIAGIEVCSHLKQRFMRRLCFEALMTMWAVVNHVVHQVSLEWRECLN